MMQEYDDDFLFEEDKIKLSSSESSKPNKNIVLLTIEDNAPTSSVQDQETLATNVEINDPFEDPITIEDENETTGCVFNDMRRDRYMIRHQYLMGMTVTSGSVTLKKDEKNLIGISIGGGAPLCPCLYIVQIFDNTPADKDGTLQSGDELVGVNGQSVKGKTKVEVAKMIQSAKDEVTINYNKLHADPKQGKSLDIIMKKMKHRLVENMSFGTADALGLSRAILSNDSLVAKLNEMRETENTYKGLVEHAKRMLKSYFDLLQTYKSMGDIFAAIGVREPQARASEAFTKFGQTHRALEREGIKMLKLLKPILADMGTYLNKAIPDTKLTIRKYADTKFEYLSYCLKVKEMDDEEYGYNAIQEPLYRVETGNYEYRLILRCRQEAKERFAKQRLDVLVKLELLDNKKTQDVAYQLKRFIEGMSGFYNQTMELMEENRTLFPVEMDLCINAFQYKLTSTISQDMQEEEGEIEYGTEIHEYHDICEDDTKESKASNRMETKDKDGTDSTEQLLPGLSDITLTDDKSDTDNMKLLTELGLIDTNTSDEFGAFQNGLVDEFMPKGNDDTEDVFDKILNDICN